MKKTHIITGATGFVGGAIVLELLKKTEDILYCLVRGEDIEQCNARLKESLQLSALAFDESLSSEIEERCFAIKGDLHEAEIPHYIRSGKTKITSFWHSAASLKYSERDKEFISKVNIEGTKQMCELSNQLGVTNFHYISTAYVCGKQSGRIEETIIDLDNPTSNFYEKSKIIAENYLLKNCKASLKIMRPSIVIGHSKTFVPTSFSGMYGFIIDTNIFRRKVEKELGFILEHRPVKILSIPDDPINLIPIDYVSAAAVSIGLSHSNKKIFHLTNDTPARVGDPIELIFENLHLKKPVYVTNKNNFTEIDRKLDENLDFYSSYLSGVKYFDRSNSHKIEGVYYDGYKLDRAILTQQIEWYMNYFKNGGTKTRLEKKNFEKSVISQFS